MIKKISTFGMCFAFLFAAAPSPVQSIGFDDASSFQLARAMKLGRGKSYTINGGQSYGAQTEYQKEIPCDSNCAVCDKTTGTCSQCESGFYLYNNTCNTCPQYATCDGSSDISCPVPRYFKEGNACYDCATVIENCIECSNASQCTACVSPYVVSDDGKSCVEPPTCAAQVAAKNSNVAVATDSASFSEAMSSGKSVILIDGAVSTSQQIALGSKKLVGPKYFSDIALCAAEQTPTLTVGSASVSTAITLSGGEINGVNISFPYGNTSATVVSGSGTIKDSTVTAKQAKNVVAATGAMTLSGTVSLTSVTADGNNYADSAVLATNGGTLNIAGTATLNGYSDYGLSVGQNTTAKVSSSGALHVNMPKVFVGVDVANGASFIADGAVVFDDYASSAIGYITTGKAVIKLNANGNVIKTYFSGLSQTHGDIVINGSTTIECYRSTGSSSCSAIDSHETYSDSVNSVTINAPVTLKGFDRNPETEYLHSTGDTILSMVGGTLKINSTIESIAGSGKVLINGDSQSMSASSAILGAGYLYGYGKDMTVSSGARLKLGGVCKKATASGTMSTVTYDKATTTPPSPFTGGC